MCFDLRSVINNSNSLCERCVSSFIYYFSIELNDAVVKTILLTYMKLSTNDVSKFTASDPGIQ